MKPSSLLFATLIAAMLAGVGARSAMGAVLGVLDADSVVHQECVRAISPRIQSPQVCDSLESAHDFSIHVQSLGFGGRIPNQGAARTDSSPKYQVSLEVGDGFPVQLPTTRLCVSKRSMRESIEMYGLLRPPDMERFHS